MLGAIAFDGSETLIPHSQVLANDYEVEKSDAYWITAWFLVLIAMINKKASVIGPCIF